MTSLHSTRTALPRVCVLLATHNGGAWLQEQLESVLAQEGVQVRVVASDDMSSDSTVSTLARWADRGLLMMLPPVTARMGNANRNFLRLIRDTPIGDSELFALSDQDDIWSPDKLQRAAAAISTQSFDAYSSNVVAFWPDGRSVLLNKAQPQRRYDHVFESSGPGCTFVFPRHRFVELQQWVQARHDELAALKVHDWLIYAYARERGWQWHIDPRPGLRYRQHTNNEAGANHGWNAFRARMHRIRSGLFRNEALTIADAIGADNEVVARLRRYAWRDRLWLALHTADLRRRRRDQLTFKALLMVMPKVTTSEVAPIQRQP